MHLQSSSFLLGLFGQDMAVHVLDTSHAKYSSISYSCKTVLSTTLEDCPSFLATDSIESASPDQLSQLCESKCLSSLINLQKTATDSCNEKSDIVSYDGKDWPITSAIDLLLYDYAFKCQKDSSSAPYAPDISSLAQDIPEPSRSPTPTPTPTPVPKPPNAPAESNPRCAKWHEILWEETCEKVANEESIPLGDFYFLNPEVNFRCNNLRLGFAYCVRAVGDISTYPGYQTVKPTSFETRLASEVDMQVPMTDILTSTFISMPSAA